ncbi:MAG: type I-B CRISPR-associated protein Cas7/Csh2 [Candidatus Bathyarchaeota archaeon]|nr:type I-B CRISPR-associated protein Cas7/Csh2 [Candidatus Bathyarchaeota archaeon]
MSEIISNRSEIVFLYDVKDSNPNGDPLDENKPRIDEETMVNLVTDVRLKRTVRDYLHDFRNEEVFILAVKNDKGTTLKTKKERMTDMKIGSSEAMTKKCVDIRLFGATAAVQGKTITLTGPVQFKIGRSLHKVQLKFIKGTTVYPSDKGKDQGTFTEMYVLPYSLIGFYGIINENAAKHTKLTTGDVDLLMDALWNGTKNLISRSKVGQMPRLLLKVNYKEKNYHIGDLNELLELKSEIRDEEIRDVEDYVLDVTKLLDALQDNSDKIKDIDITLDERVTFKREGEKIDLSKELAKEGLTVNQRDP